MSPYIFILVMELLSRMLLRAEIDGCIKGIKIARNAPSISHLFFADDSLFCFKATHDSCREIIGVIDLFCDVSGEAINFEKSNVIFSPSTPVDMKSELKQILYPFVLITWGSIYGEMLRLMGAQLEYIGQ